MPFFDSLQLFLVEIDSQSHTRAITEINKQKSKMMQK
jgi:hypothetical protein